MRTRFIFGAASLAAAALTFAVAKTPKTPLEEMNNAVKTTDYPAPLTAASILELLGFGAAGSKKKKEKNLAQQAEKLPEATETKTADIAEKLKQARTIQDLEAIVNMANTPEECQYIITCLDNPNTKAVNSFKILEIIARAKTKAEQLASANTHALSQAKGNAPAQATTSGVGVNPSGSNNGDKNIQTSFVPNVVQDVHARIVNGDFGAFGTKSASQIGKELKAYAEKNKLKFIENGSVFELQDANGNTVREVHEGLFDGKWYDHHQTFNADNKITNRFVVNHNGKLQSTVEYFYDENGNQVMSFGYGGKAGASVMVFEGPYRSQLTIQEFIEKYGFEPKYYREINPTVEFESPMKNTAPVSSMEDMNQNIANDDKAKDANKTAKTENAQFTPSKPSPSGAGKGVTQSSSQVKIGENAGASSGQQMGESLTNPLFPTEFNETTFQAWADDKGFTFSIENGIALFKDADGHIVRRITNDYTHPGQVYDDHIFLYENGKEVGKFFKYYGDESIKYYYNYSDALELYTGKAVLCPDGQWYDLNTGKKLDKNPVTAKPNTVANPNKLSNSK